MDPNNPIITLPDGTTAQVQGVATVSFIWELVVITCYTVIWLRIISSTSTKTYKQLKFQLHQGEGGATIQTVQSLTDANGHENMTVDLTEATLNQDGQIIITGEDGQGNKYTNTLALNRVTNFKILPGYPVSVGNMITLPVSASMYQTMMANIQQIQPNGDGTVCITPMQVDSNDAHSSNNLSSVNSSNDSSSCSSSLNYIQASSPSPSTHHQNHHHHQRHHHQQQHSHAKVSVSQSATTTNLLSSGKLVRAIFQDNIPNRNDLNPSDLASQTLINHSSNHSNNTTSNNNNHNSSQRLSQQEHEMFGNTTFIISTTPSPPLHQQQHHHRHPPLPPSSSAATLCSSSPTPLLTTVINRANNPCHKQVQILKKRKQSFNEILLDQEHLKKRPKEIQLDDDDEVGVEKRDGSIKMELSPSKVKMEIADEIGSN